MKNSHYHVQLRAYTSRPNGEHAGLLEVAAVTDQEFLALVADYTDCLLGENGPVRETWRTDIYGAGGLAIEVVSITTPDGRELPPETIQHFYG